MSPNYQEAKARRADLDTAARTTGEALRAFPGAGSGPMGLTPDAVKFSPQYKAAKLAYVQAFAALRDFNHWFTKTFKKEIAQERARSRASRGNDSLRPSR